MIFRAMNSPVKSKPSNHIRGKQYPSFYPLLVLKRKNSMRIILPSLRLQRTEEKFHSWGQNLHSVCAKQLVNYITACIISSKWIMLGGSSDVQKWVAFIICGPCQRMENISIRNWAATIINHENSFGLNHAFRGLQDWFISLRVALLKRCANIFFLVTISFMTSWWNIHSLAGGDWK